MVDCDRQQTQTIRRKMLIKVGRSALSRFGTVLGSVSSRTVNVVGMASAGCQDYDGKVVPKDEVVRFIEDCMRKAGTTPEDAHVVGHHLMTADYRGHFSHGMNRMQMYVQDIENRITDPAARPQIVTDFQVRTDFPSAVELECREKYFYIVSYMQLIITKISSKQQLKLFAIITK